ncbi:HdeD family acid-resistance protein [Paenirhodobacter enshiensis]|uniref:HdeD protein n=1 Tax=Paenirhodobacter enshiensis TaxID=1105367 RepID=A0A086Y3S0_9RHOB|nr:DUF308 domain-containing protein [Paenirhodobacter enshiensis]KFI28920.1 hypothetical protein CG50_12025 [Paenirhodobacter enshiensis]
MKGTTSLIVSGALALAGGAIALIFPLPASLAVTLFVGWAFLFSGALGLWSVFSDKEMPSRGWAAAFALLDLVVGVWMLANPLAGMVSLTAVVGALFFVSGIVRLYMAFALMRGTPMFWMMLISGVISAGLGAYILFTVPESSLILLGTLLAIELIVIGSTLISLGLALRNSGK